MSSAPQWDSASPEDWALATAREAVVRRLAAVSAATAREAAKKLGHLVDPALQTGRPFSSTRAGLHAPTSEAGPKRQTHRLAKTLERLVADTIDEVYSQRERPRVADLIRAVNARCHAAGTLGDSLDTVRTRVRQPPPPRPPESSSPRSTSTSPPWGATRATTRTVSWPRAYPTEGCTEDESEPSYSGRYCHQLLDRASSGITRVERFHSVQNDIVVDARAVRLVATTSCVTTRALHKRARSWSTDGEQ